MPLQARADWISTEEVARAANVVVSTISRWRSRGLLPDPVLVESGRRGRKFRWPPDTGARAAFIRKGIQDGYTDLELQAALRDGTWRESFKSP